MYQFEACHAATNKRIAKIQCLSCGYWAITGTEDGTCFTSSNRFTLEFSTISGEKEKFCGTKQDIQRAIDRYDWESFNSNTYTKEQKYREIANCIEILKYGYQFEFKENDYSPYEITVDNGLWMKIQYGIW